MGLKYRENKGDVGLIKDDENHALIGELSDYGISGTTEEIVKQILKSKDKRMDDVFIIKTSSELSIGDDNPVFPRLESLVTRRELFLSQVIGKPYPTYVLDMVRNFRRDTYRNSLKEPHERASDFAAMRQGDIERTKEKAKESNPSLDKKRKVKLGYTFSSDKGYGENHPELMEGEIELTERELLEAGLEPNDYLEPEVEKKSWLQQMRDKRDERRRNQDNDR
ncbi:MAG: hypothetical protein IKR04_03440 [Clostridia bacterium]|nr:hypothetical protein [Clostridia bacterium]